MSSAIAFGLRVGHLKDWAEPLAQFKNGWGAGPAVWSVFCERYLDGGMWLSEEVISKMWPLWLDESIPEHQRAVLAMTYDRVFIHKKHYARAAADIRKYLEDFPVDPAKVNHWPAIAELFESEPDHPQLGFNMNTITETFWTESNYDEETDEYLAPDWSSAWSLYDYLDAKGEDPDEVGESE